jgi:hypothetical protein
VDRLFSRVKHVVAKHELLPGKDDHTATLCAECSRSV